MTQAPPAQVIHGDFPAGGPIDFCPERHYLLYARDGVLRLDDGGRVWSLPPARAALIAATRPITFWLPRPVTALSVLFDATHGPAPAADLSVFDMSPLARALLEELRHCTDGPTEGPTGAYDTALFDTLRKVVWRLAETPSPAQRPAGRSDLVRRALDRTEAQLDNQPSFAALAEDLAVTQRTLARHILAETGMTWRANLRRMRVIRAIEWLADPDRSITDIALGTGYASLSAFNAAFREITGQTPSDYRDSFRT